MLAITPAYQATLSGIFTNSSERWTAITFEAARTYTRALGTANLQLRDFHTGPQRDWNFANICKLKRQTSRKSGVNYRSGFNDESVSSK
jgi:hypothetical protein